MRTKDGLVLPRRMWIQSNAETNFQHPESNDLVPFQLHTLGDFFAGDLVTPEDGLFNILSRSNQDFHGLTEPIGSPYQERSCITSGCGLFATVLFEVVRTTKLHCSFG